MKLKDLIILGGIVLGVLAGVLWGVIAGADAVHVKFLGDIFLNALKMMIIPLVIASMIVGVTSLGDIRELGKTGLTTVIFYMATTGLAVLAGMVLVNIIQPGVGMESLASEIPARVQGKEDFALTEVFVGMISPNIIKSMVELDILPLIIFSLFLGGVLSTMPEKGRPLIQLFDALNEAVMKMVEIIMYFAPIGVFGLIAGRLGEAGGWAGFYPELMKLGKYALTVIMGLGVHSLITLPIILLLITGRNPIQYLSGMAAALMTAFSTASSSATLPLTMESVQKNNGVSEENASFVLPLGATINMDGTALYESVAAIFIAQSYGIHLDFSAQCIIFFTATLAAIGAAGIPEAGLVTMVIVLKAVDLPLEGIGLLLAIDWFLDRCRTTINVWGDAIGAAVVDRIAGVPGKELESAN